MKKTQNGQNAIQKKRGRRVLFMLAFNSRKIPTKQVILLLFIATTLLLYWSFFGISIQKNIQKANIIKDRGHAFYIALTTPWYATTAGDDQDNPTRSTAILYEDTKKLESPHCVHEEIRSTGSGRYSHWKDELFFSSSDPKGPIENEKIIIFLTKYTQTNG